MNSPLCQRPFPPYAQRRRDADRDEHRDVTKGHGRLEVRTLRSSTLLNNHVGWPGVQQVCRVIRERYVRGKREREVAYYVTSLSRKQADAKRLLRLSREHWGSIENGLHYVRDETMDEDRCTICSGSAAENLATVRNAALNFLRLNKTSNFASRIRSFTRKPLRLFAILGYQN
ncbi:MAG: ISAs1 family transposase [Planctomycetaceae bacterium]